MSRPDEGLIHQWLDGECTPEESARLEQLVATDPAWAAAVAEARGLIAASSRIVQSLDAVPRAMPQGSPAAPAIAKREPAPFRAKSWMRIAAGLVLVAGSAYVLRERDVDASLPVATVELPPPPAVEPTARSAEALTRLQPPTDVPPHGPVGYADRVALAPERILESPNSIAMPREVERAAQELEARSRARSAEDETSRRAAMSAESPRGAVARAPAPAPAMYDAAPPARLAGCWRVTAPPDLLGVLNAPVLRRESGDTLVLVTTIGDVTVTRAGDELRGGLTAQRVSCDEQD